MATQLFICQHEDAIIAAEAQIKELREALQIECSTNATDGNPTGSVNRDNRDCWATARINTTILMKEIERLLVVMHSAFGNYGYKSIHQCGECGKLNHKG